LRGTVKYPFFEDDGDLSLTLSFTIPRKDTARYLKEHLGVTRYQEFRRRGSRTKATSGIIWGTVRVVNGVHEDANGYPKGQETK